MDLSCVLCAISLLLRYFAFSLLIILVFHLVRRKIIDWQLNMDGLPARWWNPLGSELLLYSEIKRMGLTFREGLLVVGSKYYRNFQHLPLASAWGLHIPLVFVLQPDAVEFFLSSPAFLQKSPIYEFIGDFVGLGLVTRKGADWVRFRKMLTPTFHFRILDRFLKVFNEQSIILTDLLKEYELKDEFDVTNLISSCTLDIICETAMGVRIATQQNSDSEILNATKVAAAAITHRIAWPWLWPSFVYNRSSEGKLFKKHATILQEFTRKVIQQRRLERELIPCKDDSTHVDGLRTQSAFLDCLLDRHLTRGDVTLNDIQVEVSTFMEAGHDSSTITSSFALYLFATHPDVQKKVQKELDEIFEGDTERHATKEDLSNMKYLESCIKEVMRLFPAFPTISRQLKHKVKYGNSVLPSGTILVVPIFEIHRNPNLFPNPDTFDPDRFSAENSMNRHPYAYIPFSAGPRNCIGQKFSMMEQKVILSWVLRRLSLSATTQLKDLRVLQQIIIWPKNGLFLSVSSR